MKFLAKTIRILLWNIVNYKMDNRAIENSIVAGMCLFDGHHYCEIIFWCRMALWMRIFPWYFHNIQLILVVNSHFVCRIIFFNNKISGKWTVQTRWRGKKLYSISMAKKKQSHINSADFSFCAIIFHEILLKFQVLIAEIEKKKVSVC